MDSLEPPTCPSDKQRLRSVRREGDHSRVLDRPGGVRDDDVAHATGVEGRVTVRVPDRGECDRGHRGPQPLGLRPLSKQQEGKEACA